MIDHELLQKIYPTKSAEYTRLIDKMPAQIKPIVTQQDVLNKHITRYFLRIVNDKSFIIETDKREYSIFIDNPRFVGCELRWKIVGKKETLSLKNGSNIYGVQDTNRITVADADLTFGGLRTYISDYLEYWFSEG
jgi:predicted transcriptional regulator